MRYGRVLFTYPDTTGVHTHRNIIDDALNLDAPTFCRDMITCVENWYATKQRDPNVQANLPRLVKYRAHGILPYLVGKPLIA